MCVKADRPGYSRFSIQISNAEIIEKLKILQIENGISLNDFITKAIAEKLRKLGYKVK